MTGSGRRTRTSRSPGAVALLRRFEASGAWLVAYATGSYRGPAEHKLQCLGVASGSCVLVTASEFRTRRDIVADAIRQGFAGVERGHHGRMSAWAMAPGMRGPPPTWVCTSSASAVKERAALIELGARAVVPDFVDVPRFLSALEID